MNSWMRNFKDFLSDNGYRYSRQRELVAREFFQISGHISVDDFFRKVQKIDSRIGIATVYRTLSLLKESGLAQRRDFGMGEVAYERSRIEHHDHLVCTSCGKVIEFFNSGIEKLQNKEAKTHGFELSFHKMELYGLCKTCKKKRK